ncbi:F0F1-type ATP synthase epsilon subunit [Arthrobacter globiformis]|nr:F0F1-type ATP synthase epsilon subunit [Arthrobacter globiformis]
MKAQNQLTIANGTVTVSESSEGLDGRHIAISGGTVSVTASDGGR